MEPIEWLDSEIDPMNNDLVYSIDKAKTKYEVRELGKGGWIVLNWTDSDKIILKFAVLRFSVSDSRGENVLAACIFHGTGPSSSLRECRHTWWGDDGYIFYPEGKIITESFKVLSEFFDDMA